MRNAYFQACGPNELKVKTYFLSIDQLLGIISVVTNMALIALHPDDRSFYSLNGLGCKPRQLSPHSIAFVYKQYCQSIFRYGLECLYLTDKK